MSRAAVSAAPTENAYYAASADNALLDREAIERRIAAAVVKAEDSNELLRKAAVSAVTSRP